MQADPHGGEPFAVATIPPPPAPTVPPPDRSADPTPTGSIGRRPADTDSVRVENGVRVISPRTDDRIAERDTGPLVIDVSRALDGGARKAGVPGGLPRLNAAPERDTAPGSRPKVAIFVSGMGLDRSATQTAIETMPAAVSLAFVPTGSVVAASLDSAKAHGHEIILQLPMHNSADLAEAPHTLRPDESEAEINRDMVWLLGRFQGYTGVTNLLGGSVTGDQAAMTAILKNVGQHGLYYLDDGTSRRTVASSVAAGLGTAALQTDVVLDATADPAVVRANLNRLAAIARVKGKAVGMASGLPDHLPAIARFAADLDAQGLTLVPVSAIANSAGSLATTR
jgi:polysaccharide deacetylase 2 family uncharacterized protein YibQ